MANLELLVDGRVYTGWTEIELVSSMEALVPDFRVSVAEAWSPRERPIPIRAGNACTARYEGEDVFVGWIDGDGLDYDATTHSLTIDGRARTCDLVDCTAKHASGEWLNTGLLQIARDICRPFNIAVSVDGAALGAAFEKFALQEGESAHEALERACRQRGVLMMTDRKGDLVLTRATTSRRTATVLELGRNVLRGSRRTNHRERFQTYTAKAQTAGTDDRSGTGAAQPSARARDDGIERYRPLTVLAETQDVGELEKRIIWERNVRAGRSQRLTYTVLGWQNAEGLWRPNVLARVVDRWARVDADLLIIAVRLTRGEQGELAELELADRLTMSVEPLASSADPETSWL